MTLLALLATVALHGSIVELDVRGNRLVPDSTVSAYVGPLDSFSAPEAFRRLWTTGLFEDLRLEKEPVAGGERLVVVVREKKLLRTARFAGETAQEKLLRDALAEAGFPLLVGKSFGSSDALEVARTEREIFGSDYAVAAELRVLLPVANVPVRFGYGFNLDRVPSERRGRFFVALELRF